MCWFAWWFIQIILTIFKRSWSSKISFRYIFYFKSNSQLYKAILLVSLTLHENFYGHQIILLLPLQENDLVVARSSFCFSQSSNRQVVLSLPSRKNDLVAAWSSFHYHHKKTTWRPPNCSSCDNWKDQNLTTTRS